MIRRMDFLRGPSAMRDHHSHGNYKEWFHFLVFGEDYSLLLNFSLLDDPLTNAIAPQLTVAIRKGESWSGEVCALETETLIPGRTEVRGDRGRFTFDGFNYQIDIRLPGTSISLELQPLTKPQFAGTATLGEGKFSWLAVPHLRAHGAVQSGGEYFRVTDAPAYHDHNWGRFSWGGAYAWQWGVALPRDESGYGLVFDRVVNTRTQKVAVQGAILVQGSDHLRTFIDAEVSCAGENPQSESIYRIPPVMRMAIPGRGPNVPERWRIHSRRKRDRVDLEFSPRDKVEIGIPSDIDAGQPMILSEAFGKGTISGTIRGAAFENNVLGVYEQIERAARN